MLTYTKTVTRKRGADGKDPPQHVLDIIADDRIAAVHVIANSRIQKIPKCMKTT